MNDVSYVKRINYESFFSWEGQYSVMLTRDLCCMLYWVMLESDFCCSAQCTGRFIADDCHASSL